MDKSKFSDNLNRIMKEQGYNATTLAIQSGVNRIMVERYLNGQNLPNLDNALKLSYTLNCRVEELTTE